MLKKRQLILDHLLLRPDSSQRDLALATGISLGQINLIIKLLCDEGFLRQDAVSKRKNRYVLTQRGLAERARFSNEAILSTIKGYKKIKEAVIRLLTNLQVKGYTEFILEGDRGELQEVVCEVFNSNFAEKVTLTWGPAEPKDGRVLLNLDRRFVAAEHTVNVLHEINI